MAGKTKENKATKKFELATLNANNIAELDGWKKKQSEIAKANPFIEITDGETYEEAKKRRTALRTARTDVEKQDKTIGSFVSAFRKQTIGLKEELVLITKPLEDTQQAEVSRYEAILEEKREAKRKEEEERIEKIEAKIKEGEELLDTIIKNSDFGGLEADKNTFKETVGSLHQEDYEEFVGRFNEMIVRKEAEMVEREAEIRKAEVARIEELQRTQRAKVDGLYREATEFVDGVNVENSETAKAVLVAIFKDASKFDFGNLQSEFEEMEETFINTKLVSKLAGLEEDLKRKKLDEVNALKQTLFGEVENVNKENLEVAQKQVLDLTKRAEDTHGDLFQEPASAIRHALKRQVSLAQREIEADTREAELEKKRVQEEEAKAEKLLVERSDEIKELGMKPSTLVYDWEAFGIGINDDDLVGLSDADYKDLLEEIGLARAKDLDNKNAKQRLQIDKTKIIGALSDLFLNATLEFENEEAVEAYDKLKSELETFKNEKIGEINKL